MSATSASRPCNVVQKCANRCGLLAHASTNNANALIEWDFSVCCYWKIIELPNTSSNMHWAITCAMQNDRQHRQLSLSQRFHCRSCYEKSLCQISMISMLFSYTWAIGVTFKVCQCSQQRMCPLRNDHQNITNKWNEKANEPECIAESPTEHDNR